MFQDLGIGVGLRAAHYERFLEGKPASVTWVEAITENYLDWESRPSGRPLQTLERIRRNVPVVLHGVSMSLGSTDPLDRSYLKRLKALSDRVQPAWISDHLCWTGAGGRSLHDLLPLPYMREALEHASSRIREAQDALGRRILVENVSSYLEFDQSEMTEWDFLAELARSADCGILLDVNNVYVSSVNHGFDPLEYLRAIPRDRVGQIHLAGHADKGTHLVDTHDAPVCEEVWDLYAWAARRFEGVSTMIERDANIPQWEELETELLRARSVRDGLERKEGRDAGRNAARASAQA